MAGFIEHPGEALDMFMYFPSHLAHRLLSPPGSCLLDAAAQCCVVRLCYLGIALNQHYLFAFLIP